MSQAYDLDDAIHAKPIHDDMPGATDTMLLINEGDGQDGAGTREHR